MDENTIAKEVTEEVNVQMSETSGLNFGYYEWIYAGGKFQVILRPNNVFYCDIYQANAKWQLDPTSNKLIIDWKNYGIYEFDVQNASELTGNAIGNPVNWRKMRFIKVYILHPPL